MEPHVDNTWWKRVFTMVEITVVAIFGMVLLFKGSDKVGVAALDLVDVALAGLVAVLFIHGVRVMVCYIVEGQKKRPLESPEVKQPPPNRPSKLP
jgi:hypothetical protein